MTITTHTIDRSNIDRLSTMIDKLNRRLDRNGIEGRFSYEVTDTEYGTDDQGLVVEILDTVEVSRPEAKYAGWTFMARVVVEEGGALLRVAPGQSLEGWGRPDAHRCDHCNQDRRRVTSFVVKNDDGEIRQIGSSCLELFLGVEVKGLWVLESMTSDEIDEWHDELKEQPVRGGHSEYMYDIRFVVALALLVTNGGRNYVSRARATEGTPATADIVRNTVHFRPGRDTSLNYEIQELIENAQALAPLDQVTEVVEFGRNIEGESDYAMNLRVATGSDYVSNRSFGTLVSVVAAWAKAQNIQAERKANPIAKGFLGVEKEKLSPFEATVTQVKWFDNTFGGSDRITFRTESGHVAIWWTSSAHDLDTGDEVTVTKATVKAHDQYNGIDQTILLRVKTVAKVTATEEVVPV